jgi:hypothetical protein
MNDSKLRSAGSLDELLARLSSAVFRQPLVLPDDNPFIIRKQTNNPFIIRDTEPLQNPFVQDTEEAVPDEDVTDEQRAAFGSDIESLQEQVLGIVMPCAKMLIATRTAETALKRNLEGLLGSEVEAGLGGVLSKVERGVEHHVVTSILQLLSVAPESVSAAFESPSGVNLNDVMTRFYSVLRASGGSNEKLSGMQAVPKMPRPE